MSYIIILISFQTSSSLLLTMLVTEMLDITGTGDSRRTELIITYLLGVTGHCDVIYIDTVQSGFITMLYGWYNSVVSNLGYFASISLSLFNLLNRH